MRNFSNIDWNTLISKFSIVKCNIKTTACFDHTARCIMDISDCDANMEPEPLSTSSLATEAPIYFNTHNKFMNKDWRTYKKLPEKLMETLEMSKQYAIVNRVPIFHRGSCPYFEFVHSDLSPSDSKWYETFRLILNKRPILMLRPSSADVKSPQQSTSAMEKNDADIIIRGAAIEEKISRGGGEEYTLTSEQSDAVEKIVADSVNCIRHASVIRLDGQAGSGKSFIVKELLRRGFSVKYCTTTKFLCATVSKLYNHPRLSTVTVCSFIMRALGISYPSCEQLQDLLKHISHDAIRNVEIEVSELIFKDYNFEIFAATNLAQLRWRMLRKKFLKSPRMIFFIDEYSLLTEGVLTLLLKIISTLETMYMVKIVTIVSGDVNQIQPLFTVGHTNKHTPYGFIDDISRHSVMFRSQKRIVDAYYENLLKRVLTIDDPTDILKSEFGDSDTRTIDYTYPLVTVLEMPSEYKDVPDWFDANCMHETCKMIFFSYTNAELQYNNISLALSVYNQISKYDDIDASKYVKFQVLKMMIKGNALVGYPIIQTTHGRIPILPLVRCFPYKILTRSILSLPRSTIVYLIDWTSDYVYVYHRDSRCVYRIENMQFQMNLTRDSILYGFPLQLHTSETSFSAQGLTIDRDIYANLSSASRAEVYVMLSRVRERSRCKIIHVP